jgi:hypothetical protein
LGFGIQGLGFTIWGSGVGVWDVGVRVSGVEFGASSVEFGIRIQGENLGFRGFRGKGLRFKVQGLGCRV